MTMIELGQEPEEEQSTELELTDIEALSIEDLKASFAALMGLVVTTYGDDQEVAA
jgi:hypothetical protein